MSVEKRIRSRRRVIAHERNVRIDMKLKQLSFILTIMIIIASGAGLISSNQVSAAEDPAYEVVYINSGDTIWNIAEKYNSNDNDKSVRQYVEEICELNDIENYVIHPGDAIKVKI